MSLEERVLCRESVPYREVIKCSLETGVPLSMDSLKRPTVLLYILYDLIIRQFNINCSFFSRSSVIINKLVLTVQRIKSRSYGCCNLSFYSIS